MSETVIQVENVSKLYRLGEVGTGSLAHDVNRWWHRVRGKEDPYRKVGETNEREQKGDSDYAWALRGVSFEVKRGEVLGIIGRNGAGKSTLLKILSRITSQTEGRIKIKGRIASLLEVGTGFHPELTGRENIFLNGAILGMRKAEIARKFEEIVEFSGCARYIDTPVKRYSSGMSVRLAFAVAAHLESEILIVDEVLAVGDAEFQKKCLGKMKEVSSRGGRTVLFVSHNLTAVSTLCNKGVVLEKGLKSYYGSAKKAVETYTQKNVSRASSSWESKESKRVQGFKIQKAKCWLIGNQPNLQLVCELSLRCKEAKKPAFLAIDINDLSMCPIMQALPSEKPFLKNTNGSYFLRVYIKLPPLIPGLYFLDLWIGSHYSQTEDYVKNVLTFEVEKSPTKSRTCGHSRDHGFLVPFSTYKNLVYKNE